MKTPEEVANDVLAALDLGDGTEGREKGPGQLSNAFRSGWLEGAMLPDIIAEAIRVDRAQLVGEILPARHRIDLSYDAAEGDSNDSEIEILQDVRDCYQTIVEAVGGEWEHEPDADQMSQESWPHVTEEDEDEDA